MGSISITYPTGPFSDGTGTKWCVTITYVDRINEDISISEQMDLKKERDSDI